MVEDSGQSSSGLIVVGVGASAGGLEALERMFDHVSAELTNVAFVIVQHLSPDFKSLMDELLARHTKLAIHRVEDGMRVESGAIYLIPPKKDMIISDGRLLLTERDSTQQLSLPIDHFFRSLAQDCGNRSVGIVLSGTGSDGSRGVRRIHEAGGLVIVQSEQTARFDSMPRAAIDTGVADVVVDPTEIGSLLQQYMLEPIREQLRQAIEEAEPEESATASLFKSLQKEYGLDFRYYKSTTISRRIQRRIAMTRCTNIADYAHLVSDDRDERRALYHDLLIGVTRFFRDPTAFKALEEEIAAKLISTWRSEPIRVWICACATGEEAYSIAILLHEQLTAINRNPDIKIFATDIDRESLEFASQGVYPESSIGEMLPQRLERYFTKTEYGYRIAQDIRQLIVFAPHNILRDAPFTNLHLVTCRNLLIYFNAEAQRKAISLFHFGLKAGGIMFLGSSESPGSLSDELGVVDKESRIYTKLHDVRLPPEMRGPLERPTISSRIPIQTSPRSSTGNRHGDLLATYDQLLAEAMPPAILIDDLGNVLQTFADAAKFLHVPRGRLSTSLLDMVTGDLRMALSGAIQRVRTHGEAVAYSSVRVSLDQEEMALRVTVSPLIQKSGRIFQIIRLESGEPRPRPIENSLDASQHQSSTERVGQLENELQYAKENLQATVEELETSNEELQATNEELVASNEELQSTNEELHSVNEELYTVNAEHQRKIQELTEMTADMDNLLSSTEVHTVFLDENLRIRFFTPQTVDIFNFVHADIGRRFDTFSNRLGLEELHNTLRQVLEIGDYFEQQVIDHRGVDFLLRVLPYRSAKQIKGVIITLIDVSSLKQSQRQLASREQEIRLITDSVPVSLSYFDAERTIRFANRATCEMFHRERHEVLGRSLKELIGGPAYQQAESRVHQAFGGDRVRFELLVQRPCDTTFWASVELIPDVKNGEVSGVYAAVTDTTELKQAESRYERATVGAGDGIYDWPIDSGEFFGARRFWELLGQPEHSTLAAWNEFLHLVHPDDIEQLKTALKQHIDGETESFEFEHRLRLPDGAFQWFLSRARLGWDAVGRRQHFSGSLRNVHDRKELEFALRDQILQRDRFLALLSHELRNPLGAVSNAVQLLLLAGVAESQSEPVRIIENQVRHMRRLLDDLLEVSRFIHDKMSLFRKRFDLREAVQNVHQSLGPLASEKSLGFSINLGPDPIVIDADFDRILQCILNLVNNAIRYTPAGGSIVVDALADDRWARVRVEDTGVGMSAELQATAFELFSQAKDSASHADSGMGIGVSLVKRIVELHSGTVSVSSPGSGHGSIFTFQIPRCTELLVSEDAQPHVVLQSDKKNTSAAPAAREQPSRPKIVLVDDLAPGRAMLARLLENVGFSVLEADSGEASLEVIEQHRPIAALIDVGMPGISGYEVANRLRSRKSEVPITLIAVTGFGQAEDRRKAQEAGFDHHFVKPVDVRQLIELLQSLSS